MPGVAQIQPMRDLILVRKYQRPEETPSGLFIPDAWRTDNSRALWEVVACGPKVGGVIGKELAEGDLVKTGPDRGVHIGKNLRDELGEDLWFVSAKEVLSCWLRDW